MPELRQVRIYIVLDDESVEKPTISTAMLEGEINTMVGRIEKQVVECVERRERQATKLKAQAEALNAKLAKYNRAAGIDT